MEELNFAFGEPTRKFFRMNLSYYVIPACAISFYWVCVVVLSFAF